MLRATTVSRVLPLGIALAAVFAGCQAMRSPGLTWTSGVPAATPVLEQQGQEPRPQEGLPAALSGENKPGEISLRFRTVVPPDTPSYVPRQLNDLELFIADPVDEGWLAVYRGRCGLLAEVCRYRAVLYRSDGRTAWDLDLNRYLVSSRHVEIQDVRYDRGALYFNEACATYPEAAGDACSSLIRVDPEQGSVDWRTPPLTSSDVFILSDRYVITGYGFPTVPDAVYLIDRESGEVVAGAPLDAPHQYLELQDDRLYVLTYDSLYTFALPAS